jgi:hypothetical protein
MYRSEIANGDDEFFIYEYRAPMLPDKLYKIGYDADNHIENRYGITLLEPIDSMLIQKFTSVPNPDQCTPKYFHLSDHTYQEQRLVKFSPCRCELSFYELTSTGNIGSKTGDLSLWYDEGACEELVTVYPLDHRRHHFVYSQRTPNTYTIRRTTPDGDNPFTESRSHGSLSVDPDAYPNLRIYPIYDYKKPYFAYIGSDGSVIFKQLLADYTLDDDTGRTFSISDTAGSGIWSAAALITANE